MREVAIVSTARTPIGKAYRGAYNDTHGVTLVGHALAQAISRAGLEPEDIQDVVFGNALTTVRSDAVIANDIEHTGNTSAASIPLAIEELLAAGSVRHGSTALLLSYGAGMSHAASVVTPPDTPSARR